MAVDLMDGIRRPQLYSHNRIINLRAISFLEAGYDCNPESETMSPNPTLLHRLGVGGGHRQGGADIAGGTDRAEQIGALVALIGRLARAGFLARPLVDEAVLLADPHLILEPQLDRRAGRQRLHDLRHFAGKVSPDYA